MAGGGAATVNTTSGGSTTVPGVGTFSAGTTAGSTTNIGGLAAGGAFTIDVHNLPVALTSLLVKAGITDLSNAPADQVRQALTNISSETQQGRDAISQLQQMLWFSNQYDLTKVPAFSTLNIGHLGPNDLTAVKNVIDLAGQTQQPLGDYLVTSANIGKATGIINGYVGKPVAQQLQAPLDENAALRSSAQTLLGRDPNASDMAKFHAFYDQLTIQANKAAAVANQLAANQGNQTQAATLGDALNTIGQGFGDQPEAPPTPLPPPMLAKLGTELPGTPANGAQQQAATAYYNQQTTAGNTADQALASSKLGAPGANQLNVAQAPTLGAAADEFLRQNYAPDVKAQGNAAVTKSLFSILTGGGA